jgi:hypothetical protein
MHWKAPMYRKSYKKKYGRHCFLIPDENKYPICTRGKVDCSGLRAAEFYVNMYKEHPRYKTLKKKINKLKKKHCSNKKR